MKYANCGASTKSSAKAKMNTGGFMKIGDGLQKLDVNKTDDKVKANMGMAVKKKAKSAPMPNMSESGRKKPLTKPKPKPRAPYDDSGVKGLGGGKRIKPLQEPPRPPKPRSPNHPTKDGPKTPLGPKPKPKPKPSPKPKPKVGPKTGTSGPRTGGPNPPKPKPKSRMKTTGPRRKNIARFSAGGMAEDKTKDKAKEKEEKGGKKYSRGELVEASYGKMVKKKKK
jgi:hypothetical protein